MIRFELIHPEIRHALTAAGPGAQVLLADNSYPLATGVWKEARRIYLNLAPGMLTVTDVLRVLVNAVTVQSARALVPDSGPEPAIFADYRDLLPGITVGTLTRFPFYDAARSPTTALVIVTGEQRTYACILLIIGAGQA